MEIWLDSLHHPCWVHQNGNVKKITVDPNYISFLFILISCLNQLPRDATLLLEKVQ